MSARGFAGAVLALSAFSIQAAAPGSIARICYSLDAAPPTSATLFDCGDPGLKTIDELAEIGFRVVQMQPRITVDGNRIMLLIEYDDRVFGNGFD